jgi:hypothetical protein
MGPFRKQVNIAPQPCLLGIAIFLEVREDSSRTRNQLLSLVGWWYTYCKIYFAFYTVGARCRRNSGGR